MKHLGGREHFESSMFRRKLLGWRTGVLKLSSEANKIFGPDELPSWIDPLAGSSYEQILTNRGWGFLSEDESEPRFAFDLMETGPWERAREARERHSGDEPTVFSPLGYVIDRMTDEEVEEAAASLTPAQRHVLLAGGTDASDSKPITTSNSPPSDVVEGSKGVFVCALGGLPLFSSEDELPSAAGQSSTNWSGFRRPVDRDHVILREESGPLRRTEVLCARSGAHLGHVFDDGPPPTRERFCINRSALVLIPHGAELPRASRPVHRPSVDLNCLGSFGDALRGIRLEAATFAGGCFWHVRDDFLDVTGVHEALCGFCGRIEVVRIRFDPVVVSYSNLAWRFFGMHDPTTGDRQGNDWGPQYQAALFPHTDSQERAAEDALAWARDELRALRRRDDAPKLRDPDTEYHPASIVQFAPPESASPAPLPVVDCFDEDSNSIQISSGDSDRGIAEFGDGRTRESPSVSTADGEKPKSAWWEGEYIRTIVERMPVEDFVVNVATEG